LNLKLFALTCGQLSGDLGYLMEGGEGKAELPIPAYLIEHPEGTALFDTGSIPTASTTPPDASGSGPPASSRSTSGRERKSARGSKRSTATQRGSTSSSIPIYGHAPGHQSLKVRLASGNVVLAADACSFCRTLRERRLPRRVFDCEPMLASLEELARCEAAGARIFFGHDGEFWKTVPQAPMMIA
jgi:hypothetical protein